MVLLVVVAACGYGYLLFAFPKVPPAPTVTFDASPERLARGEYLAEHVVGCTTCHTERDWTKFSGPAKRELLGAGNEPFDLGPAGFLYSKNITPAGIGSWTDGELLRAVTQGVSKDGTPLFPLMPYPHFGAMSEDDMHAVLAYVRSWKAIERVAPERRLSFPLNLIVRTMPGPNTYQPRPSPDDKLAYGKYMHALGAVQRLPHADRRSRHSRLPGMDFAGGMEFLETGYTRALGQHHARRRYRHRLVDRAAVHRQVQGRSRRRTMRRSARPSGARTR